MALISVLFLLLVSSFTVFAQEEYHHHHHHHHHPHHHHHSPGEPPSEPPSYHHHHHPPTHAPVETPSHHHHHPLAHALVSSPHHHPPIHPPTHLFRRNFIAVQGVVYVKSCKNAGTNTLLGATPLHDGVVKLQCNNTKYIMFQPGHTDKNGYFFIEGSKNVTSYEARKCNVVLVSAPSGLKPSDLNGGVTGAALWPEKLFVSHDLPFMLYNVGPLAVEPKCTH